MAGQVLAAMAAKPILTGMIVGGLANKKDPVKGAVLGALGGATLGSALGAGATATGTNIAASNAARQATASLATNPMQSLTANSLNAITAGGTMSPAATGLEAGRLLPSISAKQVGTTAKSLTQNALNEAARSSLLEQIALTSPQKIASKTANFGSSKIGEIIKDKPLESAQFVTQALGGGEEQSPQVSPVPYSPGGSGQGFGNVPSVEQAIAGTVDSPRFIPKGLFDEGKQMLRDEEEMLMLQQQLRARGLV